MLVCSDTDNDATNMDPSLETGGWNHRFNDDYSAMIGETGMCISFDHRKRRRKAIFDRPRTTTQKSDDRHFSASRRAKKNEHIFVSQPIGHILFVHVCTNFLPVASTRTEFSFPTKEIRLSCVWTRIAHRNTDLTITHPRINLESSYVAVHGSAASKAESLLEFHTHSRRTMTWMEWSSLFSRREKRRIYMKPCIDLLKTDQKENNERIQRWKNTFSPKHFSLDVPL